MVSSLKRHKNLLGLIFMVFLTVVTQVLTLMKSSIVAGVFGATETMDAYNFANNISSFVFGFVTAGISTVIIPYYVKKKDEKAINSFITLFITFLVLLSSIILIFRKWIIGSISNRSEFFVGTSSKILVLLMLAYFFSSFSNITAAYFQCVDKYNTPKIISFISQLLVVIILLIKSNWTIMEYTFLYGSGILFNFVFEIIFAYCSGWKYRPVFWLSPETKEIFMSFLPIIFSTGVYRISLLVDSSIASRLSEGDLTVLSYSNQISNMVNTLIAGNLLIFFYPKLVNNIKNGANQKVFWDQTSFIHSIMSLIVCGYFIVGQEGISLLFEHGSFTSEASMKVFILSFIYIFGQQFGVMVDYIYRYFYALGNTKIPSLNSIIICVSNIVISIILSIFWGVYGIIAGTLFSTLISLLLIIIKFKKSVGFEKGISMSLLSIVKNAFVSISTIVLVYSLKLILNINKNIICILLYGVLTIIVYCLLTFILNKKIFETAKKI